MHILTDPDPRHRFLQELTIWSIIFLLYKFPFNSDMLEKVITSEGKCRCFIGNMYTNGQDNNKKKLSTELRIRWGKKCKIKGKIFYRLLKFAFSSYLPYKQMLMNLNLFFFWLASRKLIAQVSYIFIYNKSTLIIDGLMRVIH